MANVPNIQSGNFRYYLISRTGIPHLILQLNYNPRSRDVYVRVDPTERPLYNTNVGPNLNFSPKMPKSYS